jgi:monoamine oxidase
VVADKINKDMKNADVIIIGAGASGLMAGRELARGGKNVWILEARNRMGGRIHTIYDPAFDLPVESGAEFIHGDLPLTFQLLKDAGIEYYKVKGRMVQLREGKLTDQNIFNEDNQTLVSRLKELKNDMSVDDFLETYFHEEKYDQLKNSIKGFVQGFDAADTGKASTFAFRDEWLNEDEWTQYRIHGGYGKAIEFLAKEFEKNGGRVFLNEAVKEIQWDSGRVEITSGHNRYIAGKVIVTVPLGVLFSKEGSKAHISFRPAITEKIKALRMMGFGSVIKIILQFRECFWQDKSSEKNAGTTMKDAGFIFSGAGIPTWWTQFPKDSAMLTGWLAGPRTKEYKTTGKNAILEEALNSLSSIFKIDQSVVKEKLAAHHISNWDTDPFSLGAYSYATTETKNAKISLLQGLEKTLFFSGEALDDGWQMGTVEAALSSGLKTARRLFADE